MCGVGSGCVGCGCVGVWGVGVWVCMAMIVYDDGLVEVRLTTEG